MTRLRQKVEERLYAECAIALMGKEWHIHDSPDEINWPDLLVNDGNQDFGLEVRKLYTDEGTDGSPKRAAESRRAKQLQKAAMVYYQDNSIPVQVKIYGDPGEPIKLVSKIVSTVASLQKDRATFFL